MTNADRRLTIFFIGAAALIATLGIIVLSALSKPVPDTLIGIAIGATGILSPSPLSKTTVAPDVAAPPV
jgi:hypothetical protein